MPTPAEREQWRTENADLIEFITTPANQRRSRFISRLADSLREWNSLTDAQTRAARNVMRELSGEAPVATEEATLDDAPHIPNGTFTVNDGAEHLTFQVYTVRRGSLQGKRIIKRQLTYGEFKGFAFLNRTGDGIRVWRSHAEDEVRNERYIVWARILIAALHEMGTDGNIPTDATEFETTYADGSGYTIQASVVCRRCNRALTDPTSIALRIGPECRNLEQTARTTAANAHEPVTMEQVAQSSILSDDADQIISLATGGTIEFSGTVTPEVANIITGGASQAVEAPMTDTEQMLIERIAEARSEQRAFGIYGERACEFCGRNNFQSPQGRGRHVSTCRRQHNSRTLVQRAEIRLGSYRSRNGIVREDGHYNREDGGSSTGITTRRPVAARVRERLRQQVGVGIGPRTPNPSALGTIIGGSVWEQ